MGREINGWHKQPKRLRLAVPRDGTSHCPFVPDKNFPCPTVPLSQERAAAKIPGKISLSWDVLGQNHKKMSKEDKNCQKIFSCFFCKHFTFLHVFPSCPVAVWGYSVTGRDRLSKSRPGLSRGRILKFVPFCLGRSYGKI